MNKEDRRKEVKYGYYGDDDISKYAESIKHMKNKQKITNIWRHIFF